MASAATANSHGKSQWRNRTPQTGGCEIDVELGKLALDKLQKFVDVLFLAVPVVVLR